MDLNLVNIGAGLMIAMFVLNIIATIVATNTVRQREYTPALVIFVVIADMLSIGVLLALLNRPAL